MELKVREGDAYLLCYDREDGAKNVVFCTFESKPSPEEMAEATRLMSERKGYEVEPVLWNIFCREKENI